MEKLKKRWGIRSNFQLLIILIVFAITGSVSAKIAGPVTEFIGLQQDSTHIILYWMVRILIILPVYQVLLLLFGLLFGQFNFFWNFEKKMLNRIGLKI